MSDEHSPDSYRLLFGIVGAALLAVVAVFIVASIPVAPLWVVVVLGVLWLGGVVISVRTWRERMWAPVLVGTLLALLWIVLLTVGTVAEGPP
jgi:hypothetical protein